MKRWGSFFGPGVLLRFMREFCAAIAGKQAGAYTHATVMTFLKFFVAGVALVFATGCANVDKEFGEEIAKLTPVEPPTFINGEIAEQFGAANFTARVEVHKGIPGTRPPIVGDFFGRNGSLFFASDEQKGKSPMAGGLSAFWDAQSKTAYLLNEPLQAYAPMKNSVPTGPAEARPAGEEMLNGERCRKTVIYHAMGTNAVLTLIVWRSVALQDFPIRIQSTNNAQSLTLNFTRVKFQAPPADLFTLPNGFKSFDSTDAMMSELVRRRTEAMDARSRARLERYGTGKSVDEEPIQQRPVRPY